MKVVDRSQCLCASECVCDLEVQEVARALCINRRAAFEHLLVDWEAIWCYNTSTPPPNTSNITTIIHVWGGC